MYSYVFENKHCCKKGMIYCIITTNSKKENTVHVFNRFRLRIGCVLL